MARVGGLVDVGEGGSRRPDGQHVAGAHRGLVSSYPVSPTAGVVSDIRPDIEREPSTGATSMPPRTVR